MSVQGVVGGIVGDGVSCGIGGIVGGVSSAASDSLLTNLVAWWSLDESSGTRVNNHNSGTHDLTDNNTVGSQSGLVGNEAVFVAANTESLSTAHHADLQILDTRDFSVAGWFTLESASDSNAELISKKAAGGNAGGWALRRDGTNEGVTFVARRADNGQNRALGPISVTYGTRFFFITQFTSATDELSFEINRSGTPTTGVLVGGQYASETGAFAIGAKGATLTSLLLDGAADEISIAHRLWTDEEKDRLYNSGSGMAYPG